jgi:hypothetical protein
VLLCSLHISEQKFNLLKKSIVNLSIRIYWIGRKLGYLPNESNIVVQWLPMPTMPISAKEVGKKMPTHNSDCEVYDGHNICEVLTFSQKSSVFDNPSLLSHNFLSEHFFPWCWRLFP